MSEALSRTGSLRLSLCSKMLPWAFSHSDQRVPMGKSGQALIKLWGTFSLFLLTKASYITKSWSKWWRNRLHLLWASLEVLAREHSHLYTLEQKISKKKKGPLLLGKAVLFNQACIFGKDEHGAMRQQRDPRLASQINWINPAINEDQMLESHLLHIRKQISSLDEQWYTLLYPLKKLVHRKLIFLIT